MIEVDMVATLRILHISDLHARGFDGPQQARAEREAPRWQRVLGDAWLRNLEELCGGARVDLIAFTGDLADWGCTPDHIRGAEFLAMTCDAIGLPRDKIFAVPGNHDIDRGVERQLWQQVRDVAQQEPDAASSWFGGGAALRGLPPDARERVLKREESFWRTIAELRGADLRQSSGWHPHFGYRHELHIPGCPRTVHIIGLDSAWLAGDESDAGKLHLTEDQVLQLTHDRRGQLVPGVRIALVHHPLGDLASSDRARHRLSECVDLLLRGHQHDSMSTTLVDPDRRLHELAAGSLFEGDHGDTYLNGCHLIELSIGDLETPIEARVRFRGWSPRGFWHDNTSLYRHATSGRLQFHIPAQLSRQAKPSLPPPVATASPRYQKLATVYRGHYSDVTKCRNLNSGLLCVVKRTQEDLVSKAALQRLQTIGDPRVVVPTNVWSSNGFVHEELPYVGGIRLSDAIGPGCGGLTGSVLVEFVEDLDAILRAVHRVGVIHRDVHPDNLYLVLGPPDNKRNVYSESKLGGAQRYSDDATAPFSITWRLVDNTFAITQEEAHARPPISHGVYTSEEQARGMPLPASDYYSMGATLYACILGADVPSAAVRRANKRPMRTPHGAHCTYYFDKAIAALLSLNPADRHLPHLSPSTTAAGFTGLIRVADARFMEINTFQDRCRLLDTVRARALLEDVLNPRALQTTLPKEPDFDLDLSVLQLLEPDQLAVVDDPDLGLSQTNEPEDPFAPMRRFCNWETSYRRAGFARWLARLSP